MPPLPYPGPPTADTPKAPSAGVHRRARHTSDYRVVSVSDALTLASGNRSEPVEGRSSAAETRLRCAATLRGASG